MRKLAAKPPLPRAIQVNQGGALIIEVGHTARITISISNVQPRPNRPRPKAKRRTKR